MRGGMHVVAGCLMVVTWLGQSHAEIPQMMNYQGKVTDTGGIPIPNGTYAMEFGIYEQHAGGSPLWSSGVLPVDVTGGVFSILLGEAPQPPLALQFEVDLWLEVVIEGDVQSPRRPLASVGYAYMASGLVPGTEITGSVDGGMLRIVNDSAASDASGLRATSYATSGHTHGIYADVHSPDGSAVMARNLSSSGDAIAVYGQSLSSSGTAVYGQAAGTTGAPRGIHGLSAGLDGVGVLGEASSTAWSASFGSRGVEGRISPSAGDGFGVLGTQGVDPVSWPSLGAGLMGYSDRAVGAAGWSSNESTVNAVGVWGRVIGTAPYARGVLGSCNSPTGHGVQGLATAFTGENYGGWFSSSSSEGYGVRGKTASTSIAYPDTDPVGVLGLGGTGIRGESSVDNGVGVAGVASGTAGIGVYGNGYLAGYFDGNVYVYGWLNASGGKSFLIDHPLDPGSRYLAHACVESDQVINLYRGTVVLDETGGARVTMPEWFQAINTGYAYHLTAIGAAAPSLHVAKEMEGNAFEIGGGSPGTKVSWMVTAQRNDAWMRDHGFAAERDKADHERGYYLTPEAYGQPAGRRMIHARENLAPVRLAPEPERWRGIEISSMAGR